MSLDDLPIAVIGAGPVGLAAAAHLIRRGRRPLVLEAGAQVGYAVRKWGHVRMFSPWRFNIDEASRALLAPTGWRAPAPDHHPTGDELIRDYLEPLAHVDAVRNAIVLNARVVSVGRRGFDKVRTAGRDDQPFIVTTERPGHDRTVFEAKAVIDASGTFLSPNPAGSGGIPAIGEAEARTSIFYGIPDVLCRERRRYAGRRVLVVGSGHSAMNTLIDLSTLRRQEPATQVAWTLRRADLETVFGGGTADQLPARGELGARARAIVDSGQVQVHAPFRILKIERAASGLRVCADSNGRMTDMEVDEIVVATGFRPDLSFLGEVRLSLDPALECPSMLGPMIDPNVHSCGTVRPHGFMELKQPEKDFYILGMKSYGRAPTFLLATGYEQARSVVAALAGDIEAARSVELALPETGVCSGPIPEAASPDAGCCGPIGAEPPAPIKDAPCCSSAREAAKMEGRNEVMTACCTPRAEPGERTATAACC